MEIFIPEATKEESKSIKAINKDTVHKICSGQVVLSLAVAVKELAENAIDAGTTLVEVKLRDQGLDSVEGLTVSSKTWFSVGAFKIPFVRPHQCQ